MTTATIVLNRVQSIELPTVNWRKVCFLGSFITLALMVFYTWQINGLTKGYYLLNSYQNQITQLSEENKNLQISFAESSFLGQALEKVKSMNFQKTTSVRYVQIKGSSAALAHK